MQKAKEAISSMLNKDGQHDATIEQRVNPAVTHEREQDHVTQHNTTAVDREVHHKHHQTTVQPVKDREVRDEQHHHNILPTEHKHHQQGDHSGVDQKLHQQQGQFRDTHDVQSAVHREGQTQAAASEHHHHHIHENVQPVIEKETIQPHVVHNVVPVHETIDKAPIVHDTSVKPAMTIDQFQRDGALHGHGSHHKEHHDYAGDRLHVGEGGDVSRSGGVHDRDHDGHRDRDGHHHDQHQQHSSGTHTSGTGNKSSGTTGPHSSSLLNKLDPRVDNNRDESRTTEDGTHGRGGDRGGAEFGLGKGAGGRLGS